MYFMYTILMTSFASVYSVEWNCNSLTNTGKFNRSANCTILGNNYVAVVNTLEINGTSTDMNNLVTIIAATAQRHFYLNSPDAKLIVRFIKLVGGNVPSSGTPTYSGGSILIQSDGGELNLFSSIVSPNPMESITVTINLRSVSVSHGNSRRAISPVLFVFFTFLFFSKKVSHCCSLL